MKLAPTSAAALNEALQKIVNLYSGEEDQLISQIANLRANLNDESNDEELIAQIKLLLDGLE